MKNIVSRQPNFEQMVTTPPDRLLFSDLPMILHNFAASVSVISLIRFFTISSRTTSAIALRAEEAVLRMKRWNAVRVYNEQPAY